jgi:hypothetical protein
MKTKSHVRFFSRAAHLDVDIELADVMRISIQGGLLSGAGNQYIFDKVNPQQHPRLASRANTNESRKLAANHLKATLCEAFLKNIYEDISQYFLEILTSAARNGLDPNRLIGEHKVTFDANTILQAGSWDKVVSLVTQSVFRKLENERSTKDLLEKMNGKLNLGVLQATIDSALPYFEVRHLLVHSDGKADQKFCSSFPTFGATVGQKIKLDYVLLQNARTAICQLVEEFDQKIVANNVVAANELQP